MHKCCGCLCSLMSHCASGWHSEVSLCGPGGNYQWKSPSFLLRPGLPLRDQIPKPSLAANSLQLACVHWVQGFSCFISKHLKPPDRVIAGRRRAAALREGDDLLQTHLPG